MSRSRIKSGIMLLLLLKVNINGAWHLKRELCFCARVCDGEVAEQVLSTSV